MEHTDVIKQGVITEKSVMLESGQAPNGAQGLPRYTFEVALEASKPQIRQAVEALFGVKVVKVNTMRMPGKTRTLRTRRGIYRKEARPWKKAIVTLAEGQSIAELQA
ncbi:MAG TPA: 50S ribosomal protein L23 [Ktedonobacterales bacterium]|nr:50S ribosomal protein L23 [Ktedonobacterales bacterium]